MTSIAMKVISFTNNTESLLHIVYTILVFGGADEVVLDVEANETLQLPSGVSHDFKIYTKAYEKKIGYFKLNTRVTGDMFDKKYSLSITGDTITASSIEPQ